MCVVLGIAAIYGCGGGGGNDDGNGEVSADYRQSVQNIHTLATAMAAYTNDHDDVYPPTNRWMDALAPYVPDQNAFISPAIANRADEYGYAFNSILAGINTHEVMNPDTTVMLFDSTFLQRNATATTFSLPDPPRYDVSNTIAYASGRIQDGHLIDDGEEEPTSGEVALSRMRQLATGLAMYAGDYDDRLPLAHTWVDATLPYVKNEILYRSPALASDPNAYGFAFNVLNSGKTTTEFESPATTLSIFDSTLTQRNAFGNPETMPNPARYTEGNAQAFVDGHAVINHNRP